MRGDLEWLPSTRYWCTEQKGQKFVEYQPDLSFNDSEPGSSGGAGGFFDEEEATGGGACSASDPRFDAKQTLELVLAEERTKERDAQS